MTNTAHARFLAALLCASVPASAQHVERISVSSSGELANSWTATLTRPSDDGRFVAFTTTATNLAAPDTAGTHDVFLRDRIGGTTTRIRSDGFVVDITPDGRQLSYTRTPISVGGVVDLGTDAEIALSSPPILTTGGRFSADGRFLLYMRGTASTNGVREVLRRELAAGTDDLTSATFGGAPNSVIAFPGHLSADGSVATFTTADPGIVPGDANGTDDAFYKDYGFGFTDRYSLDDFGGELPLFSNAGTVTPDTRFFLFTTLAAAVPDDTNGTTDLYVYDRFVGELHRLSISSNGEQANGATQTLNPWISADGTRVIFDSVASNLVAGDTNGTFDVFEHDVSTGVTRRIVLGVGGAEPNGSLDLRGVSSDGRYLTILSDATNLVAGPQDGQIQAYLVDLGPQCVVTSYCTALPNSAGLAATIQVTGTPSFTQNNLVLSALDLPGDAPCVFFHGTSRLEPAAPFGDGLRCVGGTQKRLGMLTATGGTVIQFQDLNGVPYAGLQPGDVRRFQLLYRDAGSSGAGFNTTAALEVTFCP
jgi:hypothetical protein